MIQQLFVTLHAKMVAIAINLVSVHVRTELRAQDVNVVSHITINTELPVFSL